MRFRLAEVLLGVALIACVLAWMTFLWNGGRAYRTIEQADWQMGALFCATILILAFGSRIWPNLVPNTGAVLLMILFGLFGLVFIGFLVMALFR